MGICTRINTRYVLMNTRWILHWMPCCHRDSGHNNQSLSTYSYQWDSYLMCVAAQYSRINLELYVWYCNWTHLIMSVVHSHDMNCAERTALVDWASENTIYITVSASNKVHNNKREITSLCRSNLIGCLQSTVPLRHLIKDYFLCNGSDSMCKQWVLQWVSLCISMCEKKLGAGAFLPCWDIHENVVQIQQKACDSVLNYFWAVAGPATAWFCPAVPASP